MDQRYGMTIPFGGVPLHAQREWVEELVDLGYTDVWSSEADGADAFTPLVLASVWAPSLRLGSAIVPAFTRGPACLAQSVASLADAAPGPLRLRHRHVVERDRGGLERHPVRGARTSAPRTWCSSSAPRWRGRRSRWRRRSFKVRSFKLGVRPEQPVPILIAALREGMLKLAGREGDGAIINWLGADDVKTVAPIVQAAGDGSPKEVVARIFVAPTDDADTVRGMGRFAIAAYLNVPVYAAFHEWLGRGEILGDMWRLWKEGDRKAALAAIPDQVVDDLIVWGSPEKCREHIQRYVDNGVTTPALAILPFGLDTATSHPRPRPEVDPNVCADFCVAHATASPHRRRQRCFASQSLRGWSWCQPSTTLSLALAVWSQAAGLWANIAARPPRRSRSMRGWSGE